MKNFLLGTAATMVFLAVLPLGAEITVVDTPKYVEFRIPFRDMFDHEKKLAIEEGANALIEGIRERFPTGTINNESLTRLIDDPKYLDKSVKAVRAWVTKEKLFGLHVIPSGFLVYLGGKFSANLKIGGAASVVGAVVLMPMEIIRVNKITAKKVTRRWVFDSTAVVIGNVNGGVGVGGGLVLPVGNVLKSWIGDVDAQKIYDGYNQDGGEVETVGSIEEARTGVPRLPVRGRGVAPSRRSGNRQGLPVRTSGYGQAWSATPTGAPAR